MLILIDDRILNTNHIIDILGWEQGKYLIRMTPQNSVYPENESRISITKDQRLALITLLKTENLLKTLEL